MTNHIDRRHILLALSAAGLVAFSGCAKSAGAATATALAPLAVTAAPVRVGALTSTFTLTGTVVPARQANLASVVTGTIRSVNVQIGDHVAAGQLLVQIDDSTLRAELAQDEASLVQAQAKLRQTSATDQGTALSTNAGLRSSQVAYDAADSNLRRNETLFKQGYISQAALDDARSQFAAAQAALQSSQVAATNANMDVNASSAAQADVDSMRAAVVQGQATVAAVLTQIDQAAVRAPFDGVVTQRNVDPGSLASPGTPLVQVSELNPAYVNVGIPDGDLQFVHAGSEATVRIDVFAGRSWTGTVNNMNAATGQGTLNYLARVAIPNPRLELKAGMVSNVTFVSAKVADALIVPLGALLSTDNGAAVYVVDKGQAKLHLVHVGLETQTKAQITGAGIRAGTTVVTQRPDALVDGSNVRVVSSS